MITDQIANLQQAFSQYQSWEDRYRHIIKVGKALETLDERFHQEKYRIKGCQSQVWLKAELESGRVLFKADSDSILVKGIVGLLISVYNGYSPAEILQNPPSFLQDLGITEHLSLNRTNGLASMVKQIQMYSSMFNTLTEKGIENANP